jgi:hypothetical protein
MSAKAVCKVDGCDVIANKLGLCHRHYMRWYTHGDTDCERRQPQRYCSIEGCGIEHLAKGYCRGHYEAFTRHGDTNYKRPILPTECSVEGCTFGGGITKGYCKTHYNRNYRYGDPLGSRRKTPVNERYTERASVLASPCHIFSGSIMTSGYGQVRHEGRVMVAHRAAWEIANGPIPDGRTVIHLCRRRACINPEHLKLGDMTAMHKHEHGSDTCAC